MGGAVPLAHCVLESRRPHTRRMLEAFGNAEGAVELELPLGNYSFIVRAVDGRRSVGDFLLDAAVSADQVIVFRAAGVARGALEPPPSQFALVQVFPRPFVGPVSIPSKPFPVGTDGSFEVVGLPPGEYSFALLTFAESLDSPQMTLDSFPLTVEEGQILEQSFQLPESKNRVDVTVLLNGTASALVLISGAPNGAPLYHGRIGSGFVLRLSPGRYRCLAMPIVEGESVTGPDTAMSETHKLDLTTGANYDLTLFPER